MEEEKLKKSLSIALKKLRDDKNLSQEKLALKAGLDRDYIGKIERRLRNPSLLTLLKISKALDVTLSDVILEIESNL